MSNIQMKIELISVPVTDIDRAKTFYTELIGFHADHDHRVNEHLRFVQLTPPGSACSICLGEGITNMQPGTMESITMVVSDAQAAREELLKRGAPVSEVDVQPWGNFVYFSDPDGNKWALQELPKRG
ncbi:glyoxalase superfamily protein [Ktedonospora formicarum]|uniref:Glyoxalase n=1 Tax=Ktedonospora formicarum TaxID=2778364 RepID=A0A8J3MRC0_9CHLR|nr:glyoxalase superfamily protein [Ktedonospora formicarum]GHO43483.1 glyoxalase [Ktedonospora formicarum]